MHGATIKKKYLVYDITYDIIFMTEMKYNLYVLYKFQNIINNFGTMVILHNCGL